MSAAIGAGGFHDVGGVSGVPPIDFETPPYEHWELQVAGMVSCVVRGGNMTIYEMRRAVEALPPAVAATVTYYEKWTLATIAILLERGILSSVELDTALGRVKCDADGAGVAFEVGDAVLVRSEDSAMRYRKVIT